MGLWDQPEDPDDDDDDDEDEENIRSCSMQNGCCWLLLLLWTL